MVQDTRRPPRLRIRAVLFDAGATLVHPDPPVEEVYWRELGGEGAAFDRARLSAVLSELWVEVCSGEGDRYGGTQGEEAFWRGFLERLRFRLDGGAVAPESFTRLAAHFRSPGSWAVYPDVRPCLDRLSERGLGLGIVSNWDSHLLGLLEGLGLADRFAAVLVSAIEGIGKPDPEIFHRACARLAVEPAEALHVGDALREDYGAARATGLSALLLDRAGSPRGHAETIASLFEIDARLTGEAASG